MSNDDHNKRGFLNAGIDTMVDYKRGLQSLDAASKQLSAQSGLDIDVARDLLESMQKHNVVPFLGKKT